MQFPHHISSTTDTPVWPVYRSSESSSIGSASSGFFSNTSGSRSTDSQSAGSHINFAPSMGFSGGHRAFSSGSSPMVIGGPPGYGPTVGRSVPNANSSQPANSYSFGLGAVGQSSGRQPLSGLGTVPGSSASIMSTSRLPVRNNQVFHALDVPGTLPGLGASHNRQYSCETRLPAIQNYKSAQAVGLPFHLDLDLDLESENQPIDCFSLNAARCVQAGARQPSAVSSSLSSGFFAMSEPLDREAGHACGVRDPWFLRDPRPKSTLSQVSQGSGFSQLSQMSQSSHNSAASCASNPFHPSSHIPSQQCVSNGDLVTPSSNVPDIGFGMPGSIWSTGPSRGWPPGPQQLPTSAQMPFGSSRSVVVPPGPSNDHLSQSNQLRQAHHRQHPARAGHAAHCGASSVRGDVPVGRVAPFTLDELYLDRLSLADRIGTSVCPSAPSFVPSQSLTQSIGFPRSVDAARVSYTLEPIGKPVLKRPDSPVPQTENVSNVVLDIPADLDCSNMTIAQRQELLAIDYARLRAAWAQQERDWRFSPEAASPLGMEADLHCMGSDDSEWACVPWDMVRQGPVVPEELVAQDSAASLLTGFNPSPTAAFEPDDGAGLDRLMESMPTSLSRTSADMPCDPTVECVCDVPIPEEEPSVVALFRATRASRVWTVEELVGGIVHVARDQHGSRFLQQVLDEAASSEGLADASHPRTRPDFSDDWHLVYGQPGSGPVWMEDAGLDSPITEYGSDGSVDLDHCCVRDSLPVGRSLQSARPIAAARSNTVSVVMKLITQEILPHTLALSRDVFGNYVIQKLLEHAPSSVRRRLANRLLGHAALLATHPYGCRVVQRALDTVSHDQAVSIASELESDVLGCVLDQNGNHVIQKALSVLPPDAVSFVGACLTSPTTNLAYVARHPYGCRVLQRLLERADRDSRRRLVSRLFRCYPAELVCDPYGNYVAQHLVQHGSPADRMRMFGLVVRRLAGLARHKFGSNVVERLIQFGGEFVRRRVLSEVLGSCLDPGVDGVVDPGRDEALFAMLRDPYANYVIQTLLDVYAEKDDHQSSAGAGFTSGFGVPPVIESPAERAERKANGVLLRRAVRRMLPALRGCVGAKVWQMLERRCD